MIAKLEKEAVIPTETEDERGTGAEVMEAASRKAEGEKKAGTEIGCFHEDRDTAGKKH